MNLRTLALAALLLWWWTTNPGASMGQGAYSELFQTAGGRHGVDAELLAAIGHCESGYNPAARSPAGAEGLMQFMPATAAAYGVDPWDPASA
ncbi:MAG: transglycosylase SLT domain-containing protein, partial [Actinomycetota bacterium]